MTDTARLRELLKMVEAGRRDDSVEEREFEHLVNAALDAEVRNALPNLLAAYDEREKMRAVVEAAREWRDAREAVMAQIGQNVPDGQDDVDRLLDARQTIKQALAALDTKKQNV